MSDRIAVMRAGKIEQVGTTDSVYHHPETAFTATFVGTNNVFPGTVVHTAQGSAEIETRYGTLHGSNPQNLSVGSQAMLFVRPEKTQILSNDLAGSENTDNSISVTFQRRDLEGPFVTLFFSHDDQLFSVHQTNVVSTDLQAGQRCAIGFGAQDATILPHGDTANE